jgi:hypothetical protein
MGESGNIRWASSRGKVSRQGLRFDLGRYAAANEVVVTGPGQFYGVPFALLTYGNVPIHPFVEGHQIDDPGGKFFFHVAASLGGNDSR